MKTPLVMIFMALFGITVKAAPLYEIKAFTWNEDIPQKTVKEEGFELMLKEPVYVNEYFNYHLDAGMAITKYTGTTMWTNEPKTATGLHLLSNLGLDYKISPLWTLSPNVDLRLRTIDGTNTVEKMIEPGLKLTYEQKLLENNTLKISLNQPFKQYLFTFAGTLHPKTKHPHINIEWLHNIDNDTTIGFNAGIKSWNASELREYKHDGKKEWIYQPAITSKTIGLSINHLW